MRHRPATHGPVYGVIWEEGGTIHTTPGFVFRPDRKAAEDKQGALRKSWREEERAEAIARQEGVRKRREGLKTLIDPGSQLQPMDGTEKPAAPVDNLSVRPSGDEKFDEATQATRGALRRFLHPEDALVPMERPKRDLTIR